MISGTTALFVIVAVMLIVIIRRQLRQRAAQNGEALEEAAQDFKLQMEEAADRVVKRMENHVNHLELLIAEADDRILQLDEKIQRWEALSREKETAKAPLAAAQSASRPVAASVDSDASGLFSAADGAVFGRRARAPLKLSGVHEKVAAMLQSGSSMDEIARETGLGKSAIFLIQELYQAKKKDGL